MYDLLIVGAGITAATLAARLKERLKICIVDCRDHLGGNCFDRSSDGTLIHQYGPHIFHCPSPRIVEFLNAYTQWAPYTHHVTAEIEWEGRLTRVPFPYCRQTIARLGRALTEEEIVAAFFRGYSRKMWGMPWEKLPASVSRRIPREPAETPVYYRDRFVALPRLGYTHMLENMLDGVELILGTPPDEWTRIPAQRIVYTGRPDLIPAPGQSVTLGELHGTQMDFQTLDIGLAPEDWPHDSISLHACSLRRPWTRKTCYARMTGGHSRVVSTEVPRPARCDELTPYYPIETPANVARFAALRAQVCQAYPHLHLAGRMGSYRYFDMYQAVGQALRLADHWLGETPPYAAGEWGADASPDPPLRPRDSATV